MTLPTPADIAPSTQLGDAVLAALDALLPPIRLGRCPVCDELVTAIELERSEGACLACTTGPGRPAEEPAPAILRARRLHRPLVVAPPRRPEGRVSL